MIPNVGLDEDFIRIDHGTECKYTLLRGRNF